MARNKVRCPMCGAANRGAERCRICFGPLPVPRNVARAAAGPTDLPSLETVSQTSRRTAGASTGPAATGSTADSVTFVPLSSEPIVSSLMASPSPSAVAVAEPPTDPAPFSAAVLAPPPPVRREPLPPTPRTVIDEHDDRPGFRPPKLMVIGALVAVVIGAAVVLTNRHGGSSAPATTSTTVDHGFDKWIPYTDPAGRFAVEFPAKPAVEQQVTLTPDGGGFPTTVWATGSMTTDQPAGDGTAIMLAELPAGTLQRTSPDTLLLTMAGGLADLTHGTITHATQSKDGDRPLLDLRYDIPGGVMLARIIVDTDRVWIVVTTGTKAPTAAQKFLLHNFAIVN